MCGIVGYVGHDREMREVLMTGLAGLEYRGYDSAGIALANATLEVYKRKGEVSALASALPGGGAADAANAETDVTNAGNADAADGSLAGNAGADGALAANGNAPVGIGHTRWSTHGPPSDENAHPHTDEEGRVAVVHNGIIENYGVLKDELTAAGVAFASETDTEVVPHLIGAELDRGVDPERAFRRAIDRIEGSYAIAAVFAGEETIYVARNESPLVIGVAEGETFLASDVPAIVEYVDRVVYLEDGEVARLTSSGFAVTDATGTPVEKSVERIEWDAEDTGKSGYDHYMLKEIHEQPTALRQCLRGRVDELEGEVVLEDLEGLELAREVHLVACGTSYHAALYAATRFREAGVSATAFIASEYTTERIAVDGETLVIGVTQSGETADTLRALREANRAGGQTLAVTNTVASSAARESDRALYIRAGPEIGVAATKTFASQQVALALLVAALTDSATQEEIQSMRAIPDQIQSVLDTSNAKAVTEEYADAEAFLFVGRGYHYPVALEGALKFKEITYEHAEGFPAGELKHGPLALVDEDTPVFAVVTGDGETARKTLSNVKEVEARGAPVIVVTDGRSEAERYADHVLEIPPADEPYAAVTANVQLQLVAYWVANRLGRSIDKPRNLAKSVTVE